MEPESGIEVVAPTGDPARDGQFLEAVRTFLAQEEAINSILLSMLHGQVAFPERLAILVARRNGLISAVAGYTDGFNALVSHVRELEAARSLGCAAAERGWRIPGVLALSEVARAFASGWTGSTGDRLAPGMAQRMLVATAVIPPTGVPGYWRMRLPSDSAWLREWFSGFAAEADRVPADRAKTQGESMANGTPDGLVWLDGDDVPVSVAIYKARTPRGMRIGPVYTPPEHRRRGFAAAVTAATTQHLLDNGREFVCLYTDAANPTSNHVYESIGYEWIANWEIVRFVADAGEES